MRKPLEMSRSMSLMFWAFLFLSYINCNAEKNQDCYTSCGSIKKIRYPFRFKGDPNTCGHPHYELACESSRPVLYLNSSRFYVEEISYKRETIRVVDSGLRTDDCSSLPLCTADALIHFLKDELFVLPASRLGNRIAFVDCSLPVYNPSYVATAPCIRNSSSSNSTQAYLYAIPVRDMRVSELNTSCRVAKTVLASFKGIQSLTTYPEIHYMLMKGFEMSWSPLYCNDCWKNGAEGTCVQNYLFGSRQCCKGLFRPFKCFLLTVGNFIFRISDIGAVIIAYFLLARTPIGILCLFIFLACKIRRRHIWMDTSVEEFLSKYRYQMPGRYSYSDIKKMTKNFKEKLGQGGYGFVFKGKLSTGRLVAIKMLKKSKGDGQEFINEVATIGRIHHVNVVRLLGFCSEGSKRALIYEFMPNGSLEKYIFTQGESNPFCLNKMYQIALGIARGLEYLHRGCDMQILHFDIKPHNILLDDKFIPKVSDFGLAKFYPTDESIVSVTAARGTIGYIAPELVYKNVGGVSYKSDVYSFGMLLMEMAGRRKNVNAFAEHSSQIYFPLWIYDQLNQGRDMKIEDATDDDKEMTRS